MVELNVLAPMLLCQALLPALQKSSGTIVNVGSGFGSIGFAGYCGYSASKFALRGFSESLRRELSDTGIEVLYLAPRAVDTAMNGQEVVSMNAELGNKVDSPQYVAQQLLLQLQSGQARRYLGWPERFFVKLNSVFPALVDSALAKQLPVIRKWAVASASRSG
jgi:short-subunit dehydrogenase